MTARPHSTATPAQPEEAPGGTAKKILYVVGGLAAVAALWWLGRQGGQYVPAFAERVDQLGVWGPVVFILGYAVATVAFIPGALLTLAAGAIFGLAEGTAYVFVGATLGSCLAFLVARYVARGAVEKRIEGKERFAAIDQAVGREGRKIVFLMRLSPIFPYNLLNYALGLTKVRFVDYAIACVGMLPGTFLYVYYGKLLGDVAAVAGGAEVEKGWGYWTVLGLGIVATIAVTWLITKKAQAELQRETDIPVADETAQGEEEGA